MRKYVLIWLYVVLVFCSETVFGTNTSAELNHHAICEKLNSFDLDSLVATDLDYYNEVSLYKLDALLTMYKDADIGLSLIEGYNKTDAEREVQDLHDAKSYTNRTNPLGNQHAIAMIQDKFISEKEALIDLFVCESRTYYFIITSDSFNLVTIDVPKDSIANWIKLITHPLYHSKDLLSLDFNVDAAHKMYQQVFAPIESELSGRQSLIIVPDDILIGFPFECLVMNPTTIKSNPKIKYQDFENIQFLVHKYTISYNYSAFVSIRGAESLQKSKNLGRRLISMGPVSHAAEDIHHVDNEELQESPFAQDEIYKVSRLLWRHDNFRGIDLATDVLRENCSKYRWFYLTTPIIIRSDAIDSSFIYLGWDEDAKDSKRIMIDDILNCNFRSDLITLTGMSLETTDDLRGIVSIPEAFLIAGSRSVLHNLWRIHDISLSRFMSKYYYELKYLRETNAIALKNTKISSMKGTIKVDGIELSRAHPYFWASYILIGDSHVRPPTFSSIPPRMVIIFVYVIVSILSLLIIRKTRVRQSE